MTPFAEAPTRLKPSLFARFSARRAPLVFALCVLVGMAMVAWRAKGRLEIARDMAHTEARACGASLELQFSQSAGATEALGMLAKQGRGGLANSEKLQEVLRRAQLDELLRQGYDFALFIPPRSQQKPIAIASHGLSFLQDTVQQPVRVQNLELRLALKPRSGWIDKTKVGLESLAVLLVSVLVSLLVNLIETRRAMEFELKEATQRLAREAADRSQAQADCSGEKERAATAKVELRQIQAALQQAESKAAQFQAQLDASARARNETAGIHQAELKEANAALQKAQETIAQLQTRLDAAARAEKDAVSAARERLQQNQAVMADLQTQLDAATRSARDSAEKSAARADQLERDNRELQEHLRVAERAQARVTELAGLLQKAQEETRFWQKASTRSMAATSAESDDAIPSETAGGGSRRKLSADLPEKESPAPNLSVVEDAAAKLDDDSANADPSEPSGLGSTELSTSESVSSPLINEANSAPPQGAVERSAEISPSAEPSVIPPPVKAAKRKQARRDDQLRLFGNEVLPAPPTNQRAAEAEAPMIEAREPRTSAIEVAAPAEAPPSDRPNPSTGQGGSQESLQEISRRSTPRPKPTPVDPAQLRKAVNQILPLLAERDPGANDCLKDNRTTFRSTFTPEAYVEFEQLVKIGNFDPALEQLRKAVRKHGISL